MSKRHNILLHIAAGLLLTAATMRAEDKPVVIRGFVDGYYAWNSNDPASHQSWIPGTGTTAERAEELDLNLGAVDFVRDPAPVGFHLSLVAGNGADVVRTHVYRASVAWQATKKLTLEGGVYPSHIGFEGFYSKDNWSYTRGWLGELSPYYQSGLKAHYAFDGHWSGEVHLLNGWQTIGARLHAGGTQIAWSGGPLSASFNTYVDAARRFGDLVAQYQCSPALSVGTSVDRGHEHAANWLGAGAFARYALDQRHAIAVRVERFSDPDDGISGFAQRLTEETFTYEYRPAANLILKLEARHDRSTAAVFDGHETQNLVVGGAVVTF